MGALLTVCIIMLFLCLGTEVLYFVTELPNMLREAKEWHCWKKAHKSSYRMRKNFYIWKGRVCIMVFDTQKKKSVYIRERKWDSMSAEEKMRYV